MASLMTKSLSIESGALEVLEPDEDGVRVYKGIPYAAPPLGPLRWRPPQPVAGWTGVRPTGAFGPSSLQGVVWDDIDLRDAGVSEDCLYLNVWTPAAPGESDRLPAMVWIHGGGFVAGSGAEPRYDGAHLAARGVVVVTLNHRLNALGFLAHPELTAESEHHSSGAYGFLDLVAALKWVKSNIAAFGGDPDKVTIAGESAGSHATSALMASPLAKGLFARVIGESGAVFASPSRAPASLEAAEAAGLDFMRKVGARSLAEMRALPADAILAAAPGLGFRPIIDGWFLPRAPAEIFAAGEHSDARWRNWRRTTGSISLSAEIRMAPACPSGRPTARAADGRLEQGRRFQFYPDAGPRRAPPVRRFGGRDLSRADGGGAAALPERKRASDDAGHAAQSWAGGMARAAHVPQAGW
jgi:para-nitrobenzyl esterase